MSSISADFISRFLIGLTARHVGSDEFGNRYYRSHMRNRRNGRHKRFVIYRGTPEASKVPADWHGWLHYTLDAPPPEGGYPKRVWQKEHLPNLTGTIHAVMPRAMRGGRRPAATGDYEAWRPKN